jgi:hypothetical protein
MRESPQRCDGICDAHPVERCRRCFRRRLFRQALVELQGLDQLFSDAQRRV